MTNQEQHNNDHFSHKEVMLVDDNTIDNFIHQRVINFYQYAMKTSVYTSPLKALERLKQLNTAAPNEIPSFLFLDLNMPMMDGFEFMEAYAELPQGVRNLCKVVILSNSMNPSDVSAAVTNSNVFAYLTKPLIKTNLDELNALYRSTKNK